MPQLILASQSPRRRELLATAGFQFIVRARPVEEIRAPGESPVEYVRRLARAKAEAARESAATGETSLKNGRDAAETSTGNLTPGLVQMVSLLQLNRLELKDMISGEEVVLGADTVVVLGDRVLEKPVDPGDARAMLRALSGQEHVVITGICLMHADGVIVDHESTRVHFVELTDSEIDAYVLSGEPMDKAGAYAIQGLASKFVDRIEGCYFNVMGLPLALVYRHWKALTKE